MDKPHDKVEIENEFEKIPLIMHSACHNWYRLYHLGKQIIYLNLDEAEAIGFFHGQTGKDKPKIKSMISPTTCQFWAWKLLYQVVFRKM